MDNQIDDEGLRRAALEARAHLLRAVDCLAAEERDSLMDPVHTACLLYTSDAADERPSGDIGGRRIIKKKKADKQRRRENRGTRHNRP